MHWTQTPEGRKRMAAIASSKGTQAKRLATLRANGTSPGAKKKRHHKNLAQHNQNISDGLNRMWAKRRADLAALQNGNGNGHANGFDLATLLALPVYGKTFAKESVRLFAVKGAKETLVELDQLRERLVVFIQGAS